MLVGDSAAPRVLASGRVEMSDPKVPLSKQPYHDGFSTAREPGATLTHLLTSVRTFGRTSLSSLLDRYAEEGHIVGGAALVVGSLIDPNTLGNTHMRIHALEGRLFRDVLIEVLSERCVPHAVWRERDLFAAAALTLKRSESDLRVALAGLGNGSSGPWRGEQKKAALAAWLVLAGNG